MADALHLPSPGDDPRTIPEPRRRSAGVEVAPATTPSAMGGSPPPAQSLADEIRDLERLRITDALRAESGVQTRAADRLGMPVRTLFAKLRAHAIDAKEFTTKK